MDDWKDSRQFLVDVHVYENLKFSSLVIVLFEELVNLKLRISGLERQGRM